MLDNRFHFERFSITRSSIVFRFGFAVCLSIISIVLREYYLHISGRPTLYLFYYGAVLLSAWYGGFWPGILATILLPLYEIFFLRIYSFGMININIIIEHTIYIIEAVFACFIIDNFKNTDKELERRINHQSAISLLGQQALNIDNFPTFLTNASKIIAKTINVEYSQILKFYLEENKFLLQAGSGWKKGIIGKLHIDGGENSLAGFALLSNKPIYIKNLLKEKKFTKPYYLLSHDVKSGLNVAINGKDRPLGVLSVYSKKQKNFSRDDIYFLQSAANILAAAIENNAFEKRKDEFISMASHELKTPVTSIKILTQLMIRKFQLTNDEKNFGTMVKIEKQLNKLTHFINDLLDITKMQSGQLIFHYNLFDMNELVREVVENMQSTTKKHTIYIKGKINKELKGDRDRIAQVLINLLSNAIKYSPKANKINVLLSTTGNKALIRVQDFGIGIPGKSKKKIFQRFYRVAGIEEHTFPGLGIGLYIASQIVMYHSGSIWVDSVEKKGSVFSFTLPIKKK